MRKMRINLHWFSKTCFSFTKANLFIYTACLFLQISSYGQSQKLSGNRDSIFYELKETRILYDYYFDKDIDSTTKFARKFLKIAKNLKVPDSIAKGHLLLSDVLYTRGYLDLSLKHIDSSINLYRKINDTLKLIISYQIKSNIFMAQANHPKALELIKDVEKISNKIILSPIERMRLESNKGMIYYYLKQYDKSEVHYKYAIRYGEMAEDLKSTFYIKTNLGLTYMENNKYEDALHIYKELCKNEGDINSKVICLTRLGEIYVKLEKFVEAKKHLDKVLAIEKDSKFYLQRIDLYRCYGLVNYHLGNYKTAEKFLLKSYRLAEEMGVTEAVYEINEALAMCYAKMARQEKALPHLINNAIIRDSLYNNHRINSLKEIEVEDRVLEKEYEIKEIQKARESSEKLIIKTYKKYFYVLAITLGLLLFFSLMMYFKNKAALAENNQHIAESKLQALRSQMNPHFVFNLLNSVQSFILSSDKHQAYEYLKKFSNSVQIILNNSEDYKISLKDELKIIRVYVELQQLRFPDKILYEERIDLNTINLTWKIPAMILQPVVENAIVHGILNKDNGGKVILTLNKESSNHFLLCRITDDGIGMAKAREIAKNNIVIKKKSITNINTSQRIKILSKKFETKFYYKIKDIEYANKIVGTEVFLKIPIIYE